MSHSLSVSFSRAFSLPSHHSTLEIPFIHRLDLICSYYYYELFLQTINEFAIRDTVCYKKSLQGPTTVNFCPNPREVLNKRNNTGRH